MHAIPFRIAFVSLIVAATLGAPAHAQSVRVPGTAVRLVPPQGFTRAERFAGFQESGRGASIVVTEIAGPVSEVRRGMTASGLASRGMDLIESRTVMVGEPTCSRGCPFASIPPRGCSLRTGWAIS